MANYFTLVCRDSKTEPWTPQFGDFDKQCVMDEAQDYLDGGNFKFVKVIKSGVGQKQIDAAVAALNAKEGVAVSP